MTPEQQALRDAMRRAAEYAAMSALLFKGEPTGAQCEQDAAILAAAADRIERGEPSREELVTGLGVFACDCSIRCAVFKDTPIDSNKCANSVARRLIARAQVQP